MSEHDEFLSIDEVAAELRRSRPVVFARIRQRGITTYRRSPDRRTFVRRADLETLKEAPLPGRPVPITKKRGGNRRAQRARKEQP